MTKGEQLFHEIAAAIPEAKEGKMFGALCIKAPNGKAGVMFWKGAMIFKLGAEDAAEALALKGAGPFDPMGGRPMNGWVLIPEAHSAKWAHYAHISMDIARKLKK